MDAITAARLLAALTLDELDDEIDSEVGGFFYGSHAVYTLTVPHAIACSDRNLTEFLGLPVTRIAEIAHTGAPFTVYSVDLDALPLLPGTDLRVARLSGETGLPRPDPRAAIAFRGGVVVSHVRSSTSMWDEGLIPNWERKLARLFARP